MVLEDAKNTGAIPATVPGRPRRCPVVAECKIGCPGGFPAYTQKVGDTILICFDCRMSHENLQQTIAHEVQHARDFCRFRPNPRSKNDCLRYERRACRESCAVIYPGRGPDYRRCVDCCVWFSCRHHGLPPLQPPCDPNIPTRPCWRYDPDIPGFVPDPKDPRCPTRRS
jgi:hypothetical protein